MMDLIEKLEDRAISYEQSGPSAHHTASLLRKAKSEIEHLRKEDAVWRQKYRLLESQFFNCHKEIFRLREELLRYAPVEP